MEQKKISVLLTEALAVIEKPEHWTVKVSARTASGIPTECIAPDAFSFCAYGAIGKAARGEDAPAEQMNEFLRAALKDRNRDYLIASFNDEATHEDVKSLFREAIALAVAEEAAS